MSQSWSGLRKELEEDFICDKLKGRVQYFLTHYREAHDDYGRVAVRVDGKEVVKGNPYTFFRKYHRLEWQLKDRLDVPRREWTGKETLNDEDNLAIENVVEQLAKHEGVFEIYHITDAIRVYKNSSIQESLKSDDPLVRMFSVMDRRVGKRTVKKLKEEMYKQPEWLQLFYKLRIDTEGV